MKNIERYINFNVSLDHLMENVKEICKWERLSGTKAELEAFHYIEKKLKDIGLTTELILHDAYISLPISAKLLINGEEIHCHTASMAISTPAEGITGKLVYCESIEVISEEKCRHNIVMLGGTADFAKIYRAWKLGAKGIIGCTGDRIHEKIISNAWGSPSLYTKDLIPNIPYVSVNDRDAEIIRKASAVSSQAYMSTAVDTGWRKIPLLIAEVEAAKRTDKYVMFSGHVDSWYYGATDNGTANAVQIEVAKVAMEHKEHLKRNIKFVFYSGHSHGRYAGSAWHADHYWQDLHENCVINVNADIIGGVGATDLTRSIIMPEARDVAVDFIKTHAGADFNGGRCGRNGDQSYYIHGVTSAFSSFSKQPRPENPEDRLSQTRSGAFDFGWWWHTADDLLDKIEPEFFLRDAKIFTSFVMFFAISEVIPLNFHKTAIEIESLVDYWQKKSDSRFDLSLPHAKACELVGCCKKLYEAEPKDVNRFNTTIMKLGRILIPLNYTTGNIYENDTGIPLPPMPSLKLIDDLIKTPENGDEAKEIIVELVHKRNFVTNSLTEALEVVKNYFD